MGLAVRTDILLLSLISLLKILLSSAVGLMCTPVTLRVIRLFSTRLLLPTTSTPAHEQSSG